MRLRLVAALLVLATAGGCATITSGTTQDISVDSEPNGAECTLMREGAPLGSVTTPAPVHIKRHAATIHVTCRKDGYEPGHVVMNSRYDNASAGNMILGGIIGVMIDTSTGANTKYDSYVMVRLAALAPGAAPPAQPAAPAPVPAATPEVAAAPPPGPYDGYYGGGIDISRPPGFGALRQIELRIEGDKATGTVTARACNNAGKLSLQVRPSGVVRGEADLLTAGCGENKATVEGRLEGNKLVATFDHTMGKGQTDLTRRPGPPAGN